MARRSKTPKAETLLAALVYHRGGRIEVTQEFLTEGLPPGLKLDVEQDDGVVVLKTRTEPT